MIDSRKLITAVIGGLVVTAAVYADMIPASQLDAGRRHSPHVCGRVDLQYTNFSSPYNCTGVADLDSWSVEFLPGVSADLKQTSEIQHPQSLTNGPSSISLCLSALMGLGLCSSAHWVKRLSFGFVPDWYHNGGPFQIGHSYALTPESLCPVPVCCFIQPVWRAENFLRQLYWGNVAPFLRVSQFTPSVIAPRGPPCDMS